MQLMKAILRCFLTNCFLALGLEPALAVATNDFRLTVELQDGSRVVGRCLDEKLEFHSAVFGEIKLPLAQIASVDCLPKTNLARLLVMNGDKLSAVFARREIRLQTSFGTVKLPVESIRRLQVAAASLVGRTKLGLVALWSAEGNANDSVGGCHGQLVNGVGFTNGQVGQAFDFNENSSSGFDAGGERDGFAFPASRWNRAGGYVLIPASPILDVGKQEGLTFECWINPATVTKQQLIAEYERVLGTQDGADTNCDFAVQPGSILYANVVDINQTGHEIRTPANLLVAGVWQHVAVTYDKASGVAALYKDGMVVAQANLGSFTPQTSFANFLLGARTTYGSASRPNTLFSGKMDEFGIYNRALSAAEIQAIYADEIGGITPSH